MALLLTAWLVGIGGFGASFTARGEGTGTLVLVTDTGEHSYTVELATTASERRRGLMYRKSLPQKAGMLFLYGTPQPISMWMQNTYIPLDMVFIREDGRVHRVEANTEPFSTEIISSGGEVTAVLELNAGEAAAIGLKPGDQVIFPEVGAEARP